MIYNCLYGMLNSRMFQQNYPGDFLYRMRAGNQLVYSSLSLFFAETIAETLLPEVGLRKNETFANKPSIKGIPIFAKTFNKIKTWEMLKHYDCGKGRKDFRRKKKKVILFLVKRLI